jgi:hypothetical protein
MARQVGQAGHSRYVAPLINLPSELSTDAATDGVVVVKTHTDAAG